MITGMQMMQVTTSDVIKLLVLNLKSQVFMKPFQYVNVSPVHAFLIYLDRISLFS